MSLAMRPNELNTEINRLQGAMPSSLFYVGTIVTDVSNQNEKLKKEARIIDTMKANVDIFIKPNVVQEPEQIRDNQRE